MINWRSYHRAENGTIIKEIESKFGISLPSDYTLIAINYDGGIPDKKIFTAGGKQRVFSRLISIQPNKHPNVLDALEWIDSNNFIPFALDPFGNIICFYISNPREIEISYIETETQTVYSVSSSFGAFINGLY